MPRIVNLIVAEIQGTHKCSGQIRDLALSHDERHLASAGKAVIVW